MDERELRKDVVKYKGAQKRNTLWYRVSDGVQVCGARTKVGNRNTPDDVVDRCNTTRGLGDRNGRCRYHGRDAGRPIKSGRYSAIIKGETWKDAYEVAIADESLMDTSEPLALLDVVVQRAIVRAEAADTPEMRKRALTLFDETRSALAGGNQTSAQASLKMLGRLLRDGVAEDRALEHLAGAAERFSKRNEAAWAIKLSRQQSINARDLVGVMARFVEIVKSQCDPEAAGRVLKAVGAEFKVVEAEIVPKPLRDLTG